VQRRVTVRSRRRGTRVLAVDPREFPCISRSGMPADPALSPAGS
jgi:hypothetical protein